MATAHSLLSSGMPAGQANQIGSTNGASLTATGTTKATALTLTATVNVFTTVSASKGALLPSSYASPPVAIFNGGANTLSVYANGTDVINANSAGAAFSVTANKSAIFMPTAAGWVANLSA